jgi:hypothetical protein
MTPILERFITPTAPFQPKSQADLLAVRLAAKLDDAASVHHYAMLAAQHSEGRLLTAFRRTAKSGQRAGLGRRFHVELERVHSDGGNGNGTKLLSVRVERRAIAAAVFHGQHLEYTQVRQLSSLKDKALSSAIGFANWLTSSFELDSAAMEAIDTQEDYQRRSLHEAIEHVLREQVLPIWTVSRTDLLNACGYPPLKCRRELREVVTTLWPVLSGTGAKVFIQDAAALGLYVQTERLFIT